MSLQRTIPSRGLSPSLIGNSVWWWCGPKWLVDDEDRQVCIQGERVLLEMRTRINCFLNAVTSELFLFDRFSDLKRLGRVIAYLLFS